MMENNEFFDELSEDYDLMINFENALKNKISFLNNFLSSDDTTALDLGCGTGADSIALAKLGLIVDAIDHSNGMLQQAQQNSKKFGVAIQFIESSLQAISLKENSYDFIVSLGNTIANINQQTLHNLLKELFDLLNVGGSILIQIVNFSKLPKKGIHILNKFENNLVAITRKYDLNSNFIEFIIDKLDKETKLETQIVTKLYPHNSDLFEQLAKEIGFNYTFYGNLRKDAYVPNQSLNLVVELKKG